MYSQLEVPGQGSTMREEQDSSGAPLGEGWEGYHLSQQQMAPGRLKGPSFTLIHTLYI